jgi:uncharacterized protein (TIGR04141 family)
MPTKPKSRTLTAFLLKKEFTEPSEILKPRENVTEPPFTICGAPKGRLFLQPSEDRTPQWLSLFRGAVAFDPTETHNASTAAVWLLEAGGRLLALTFGYGRNLLKPGVWEEDFGLRVTLNAVDPDKIKAVDKITLDSVAQQSRTQASRDARMSEFGLDVEQDLLRAVVGAPVDQKLGARLAGRDALQATVAVELGGISQLLERYLEEFRREDYKARFPWVEHIHEVDDRVKLAVLDLELIKKLRTRNLDGLWLAVPEMMDWEGLAGFRYGRAKGADVRPDIHALTLLDEIGDAADIDESTLRRRYRVQAIATDNDAVVRQWPVYRCLYCEVNAGSETFLLNNGRWFRIASDFVQRINEAVDRVPESGGLPPYSDKSEGSYSKRVAEESNGRLALMHSKLIGSASLPGRTEFCDLYSSERQIIHLKRYSGSSTLSHLFMQGVVSAKLFLNEADFRRELSPVLPSGHALTDPDSKPNAGDYEVVYGIISQSKRKLVLPFFSRVSLKNAYTNLSGMGFRVSLSKIPPTAE